jgi:hypothetical protein
MQPGGQLSHAQSRSVYGVDGEDRCSLPGGGRCHDENVEGAHQRPGSAGFGRGRLPVVLRAPMLAGCSSCPRQRPLRSASPSIEALSAEALSAAVELRGAGCSQGWRTTHRRGNAPGPSSAGSRYLCRYGGAGWTRQVALADAMTANGSAPVEHDEEHGAGLGADAAWLGGPGAEAGTSTAARSTIAWCARRPCPFLADRVCLGPGHWTGGGGSRETGRFSPLAQIRASLIKAR